DAGAGQRGDARPDADPDALDRRNRHQRLREAAVELPIPLDVTAEAHRDARGDDLEGAAERIAGLAGAIDLRDHLALELDVDAAQRGIVRQPAGASEIDRAGIGQRDAAEGKDRAGDAEAGGREQLAWDGASRDAGRGLARAGALQDVAQ